MTTLLKVDLIDVNQQALLDPKFKKVFNDVFSIDANSRLSFGHCFILGVDPEGWVLYQSWMWLGPDLAEHLNSGAMERRSWDEGEEFVTAFDNFAENNVVGGTCYSIDSCRTAQLTCG